MAGKVKLVDGKVKDESLKMGPVWKTPDPESTKRPKVKPWKSVEQGGRSWQPFLEGKNGHENFRQAHIYYFRDKRVVFARNCSLQI